jgi:hypothetical protein
MPKKNALIETEQTSFNAKNEWKKGSVRLNEKLRRGFFKNHFPNRLEILVSILM